MTSNSIKAQQARETERSNAVRERETERSNRASEKVGKGSNIAKGLGGVGGILKGLGGIGAIAGALNDPEWYNKDKQLVADVASISYGTPLGVDPDVKATTSTKEVRLPNFPGIMVLPYVPTLGVSLPEIKTADQRSLAPNVITLTATNIYSFVRHANSGSSNYGRSDLMQYLLAMDSIYSYYAWMIRLYWAMLQFNSRNRYVGQQMLIALHVDPTTINSNLAGLRYYINQFAVKASIFNVPNTFPLFTRHMWMNLNVFKDTPTVKSQFYMFTPRILYKYWELDGMLVPMSGPGFEDDGTTSVWGLTKIMNLGEELLRALSESESIGIMSGDILKAYGSEGLVKLDSIPEQVDLDPIFSEEVLTQISGATLLPELDIDATWSDVKGKPTPVMSIVQDSEENLWQGEPLDVAVQDPMFAIIVSRRIDYYPTQDKVFVYGYSDAPTPDDTMVATRLSATTTRVPISRRNADGTEVKDTVVAVKTCGTEIIVGAYILAADNQKYNFYDYFTIGTSPNSITTGGMRVIDALIKFDRAPKISFMHGGVSTLSHAFTYMQPENYALVTSQVLARMHEVAIISLFDLPAIGNSAQVRGTSRNVRRPKK